MTRQIPTSKQRDIMSGQVIAANQLLLEVKMEMLSYRQISSIGQSITQLTKALEETRKAIRSISYLLEDLNQTPDLEIEDGQEGITINE